MKTLPLSATLESLLFAAGKPLSTKKIALLLDQPASVIDPALRTLQEDYRTNERGIRLIAAVDGWQMSSAPEAATVIRALIKDEFEGDLTRPQLETLAIVAYRGPITKPELEEIRGVNCSLIVRNLLMRGLILEVGHGASNEAQFAVSHDFVRLLGLDRIEALPDYDMLHTHAALEAFLKRGN